MYRIWTKYPNEDQWVIEFVRESETAIPTTEFQDWQQVTRWFSELDRPNGMLGMEFQIRVELLRAGGANDAGLLTDPTPDHINRT